MAALSAILCGSDPLLMAVVRAPGPGALGMSISSPAIAATYPVCKAYYGTGRRVSNIAENIIPYDEFPLRIEKVESRTPQVTQPLTQSDTTNP
jgi:hypothetical protein